jgi:hypothetical protein
MTTQTTPTIVYELISATFQEYNDMQQTLNSDMTDGTITYANVLTKVLKKHHLWPAMQVKKFKDNDNIVLLHNSYKRDDVMRFKELYDQCRSIILDFTLSINNNVVVSYANNIPERITIDKYNESLYTPGDKYQSAYDGMMITVYNYNNKWYFGSSSCPDINSSKFSHTPHSHGYMFDDILMTYYGSHFKEDEVANTSMNDISIKLRDIFTSSLDKNIAYEFVMVHHENQHIIDYTEALGMGYKMLYHINSKNRFTLVEEDISNQPLSSQGVVYPVYFNNLQDACIHNTTPFSYGFIVKKMQENGSAKLYKISPPHIDFKEETDPCKLNVWHNILIVYMKNRKDYKINDYIKNYASDINLPLDNKGVPIDPTYLIHTMISTLKDVLYNLYIATTTYNSKTNRFKMNKDLDKQFPPVIRFHLAQLRYRQQNDHKNALIRPKDVYYYLCHCNNVKNIKLLVSFLATSVGYNITERGALCLTVLNSLL